MHMVTGGIDRHPAGPGPVEEAQLQQPGLIGVLNGIDIPPREQAMDSTPR
jgi:hypothetical protein